MKEKSLSILRKKADRLFSLFIRKRDSNENGIGKCITCGRVGHFKEMDCGHYIKRQHLSTRYDEKNCNMQCKRCNAFEQGMNEVYKKEIDKKWGQGISDLLELKKHNKILYPRLLYEEIIKNYE